MARTLNNWTEGGWPTSYLSFRSDSPCCTSGSRLLSIVLLASHSARYRISDRLVRRILMDNCYIGKPLSDPAKYPGAHPCKDRCTPSRSCPGFWPSASATVCGRYNVCWSQMQMWLVASESCSEGVFGLFDKRRAWRKCCCGQEVRRGRGKYR